MTYSTKITIDWWGNEDVQEKHKNELLSIAIKQTTNLIADGFVEGILYHAINNTEYFGVWSIRGEMK